MVINTIRLILFSVGALVSLCVSTYALADRQIYPLPQTETEDVVVHWLQRMGYHLRRSTIDNHGVRLYGQKGARGWQITLRPHSPLATRVKATHTVDGTADPSALPRLWTLLDGHMQTVMGQPARDRQTMPATILSRSESVVCIYVGYPKEALQISGFIIDKKGLIICTAHGLKDNQQPLTVVLHDGRQLQGWVVKMDRRWDLSLVDVKTELDAPIALSGGRDLVGDTEKLFNIVCASHSNGSFFSGAVSGPPRKTDNQLLWQVNMQIHPGSSGSPVFDIQGNLVAVVKGRYRGAETVGFLIPFGSLMEFMSDYPK
ncbi:MAG: serine protease [Desulfobacteraceae bacterium]|jgi:S1-C subfamily serine protease